MGSATLIHTDQVSQKDPDWDAWVAQLVECLTLGFSPGHDLMGHGVKSHNRLHTQQEVCLKVLSLCPYLLALRHSLK